MAQAANKTTKKPSNAKRGGKGAAAPRSLRAHREKTLTQQADQDLAPLSGSGASLDIAGVVLAIVAVASFIAVISPSSAPVTAAIARFLHLGFGLGAYVLPLVLLAIAALLFVRGAAPVSARTAIGASVVFIAIVSFLSLFVPHTDLSTAAMFEPEALAATGGYLGASVASALQGALGKPIASVVLAGLVVLGLVIVGVSVSDVVRCALSRLKSAFKRTPVAVNERPWGDDLSHTPASVRAGDTREKLGMPTSGAIQQELFDDAGTAQTTYLGNRSTTVLDRFVQDDDPQESPFVDVSSQVDAESASTQLLDPSALSPLATDSSTSGHSASSRKAGLLSSIHAAASALRSQPQERTGASHEDEGSAGKGSHRSSSPEIQNAQDASEEDEVSVLLSEPTCEDSDSRATPLVATPEGARPVPDFLMPLAASASDGQTGSDEQKSVRAASPVEAERSVRPAGSPSSASSDERCLPPVSMLRHNPSASKKSSSSKELEQTAASLQGTLAEFGLRSRVVGWIAGPTVTTFKVQPGEGERVSRITNLEDDIALSLAADAVRIFAPIPGTSLVGIEIPNRSRQTVAFGDILPYAQGGPLEFALGRDAEGQPMVADLAKMPHLLIAGTTGSGKSVVISSIVMSLLMRTFPEDVRLIMVDPKRVEFAPYDGLPHLYVPVVTEPKQAASALQWAVSEMERRLKIFERIGVRKISTFNEKQAAGEFEKYDNPPAKMPYLVIVIDELSDLMMVAGKDVEASIVRIAQLGRAAGIHMIVATQRPSSNVVTGLIKANITNRIGLTVATGIDSRVILDQTGAEKLIGQGDMLFSRVDWGKPKRIQGCYVSDEEIFSVVEFVKEHCEADYHEEILSAVAPAAMGASSASREPSDDDPLIWEAARMVVESQLGSTSGLQRRLKVGYARAGRIMDMLEEKGVVGPPDGSKPREVLLDAEGLAALEAVEARMAADDDLGVF